MVENIVENFTSRLSIFTLPIRFFRVLRRQPINRYLKGIEVDMDFSTD